MSNTEKVKVTSAEIIVSVIKGKPYFEIKYREVGKSNYNIGYSSYDLENVIGWKNECFEIVNTGRQINADRIRSMSDDELSYIVSSGCFDCSDVCKEFGSGCAFKCEHNNGYDLALEWLQSEVEE